MNISELVVIVIVGFSVIAGFMTFTSDMHAAGYNVVVDETLNEQIETNMMNINATSSELMTTLTNANGNWLTTLYGVFFQAPATALTTMSGFVSLDMSFFGALAGVTIPGATVPAWASLAVSVFVVLTFVFVFFYVVVGRAL